MTTSPAPAIPAAIQRHIDALTEDMRGIVQHVEKDSISAGMTQHNYGGYMSAIQQLVPKADDTRMLFIVASALVAAGGNAAGIKSAVAIITGRDPLQALGL